MTSATKTAEIVGSMLRLDPVAASMVQNTVPPAELIKLLGLEGYVAQQLAEVAQNTDTEGFPELLHLAAAERRRQVLQEHFSLAHDDKHVGEELALAAAYYAVPPIHRFDVSAERFWPWDHEWRKPTPKDRRRELVKAVALLVAEDQRLRRQIQAGARAHG